MQINSDTVTQVKAEKIQEEHSKISHYMMFRYSIRSELTRKYYERRLRIFFDYIQFEMEAQDMEKRFNDFVEYSKNNIKWTLNQIINFLQFQKQRVEIEQITASTLKNFVKSLKALCDSADLEMPWKKVIRGLPKGRQSANDRAPTINEIRKLIEYPDRRVKPIVYTMVSSGIRLGAWDYLQWKHVEPIANKNGDIIAAKMYVYANHTICTSIKSSKNGQFQSNFSKNVINLMLRSRKLQFFDLMFINFTSRNKNNGLIAKHEAIKK